MGQPQILDVIESTEGSKTSSVQIDNQSQIEQTFGLESAPTRTRNEKPNSQVNEKEKLWTLTIERIDSV